MKYINYYLMYCCLFSESATCFYLGTNMSPASRDERADASSAYHQRCTRRYTPGTCSEPVELVWTFLFQIQNCTVRLGCPMASRTNRFLKYSTCMRRCRPVADLYAHLLAEGGRNDSEPTLLRSAARRDGISDLGAYFHFEPPTREEIEEEGIGDVPLLSISHENNEELSELEYLLPADADHVESVRMPGSDDIFHAFGDY